MATPTYEPIETITLGTATNSVTFSSIPQTYTDLVLVVNGRKDTAVSTDAFFCRINGDGTNVYGWTEFNGDGTTATTSKITNDGYCRLAVIPGNNAGSTTFGVSIVNFQNYSNSTTFKSILSRGSVTAGQVMVSVSSWQKTDAITSFTLYTAGLGNWAVGSIFTLYGIANVSVGAKATGGTIMSDSEYIYHVFTSSGTFTPTQSLTADYLVVAGGGGGGNNSGGGGGAGGYRSSVTASGGGGPAGSPLSLTTTAYTVTVGAGGATSTGDTMRGSNGSNSVFSTITATGGGGGGTGAPAPLLNGLSGGSGGGAHGNGSIGTGTTNQGYDGGLGITDGSTYGMGGGGGGAGVVGQNAPLTGGGNGGNGLFNAITNAVTQGQLSGGNYYLAGGGGGSGHGASGRSAAGAGGIGGGGAGARGDIGGLGTAGTVNTGGGAGCAQQNGSGNAGGGSGIVIVRYLKA
jgi:hypothetical protein